jgi:hypothetical protein
MKSARVYLSKSTSLHKITVLSHDHFMQWIVQYKEAAIDRKTKAVTPEDAIRTACQLLDDGFEVCVGKRCCAEPSRAWLTGAELTWIVVRDRKQSNAIMHELCEFADCHVARIWRKSKQACERTAGPHGLCYGRFQFRNREWPAVCGDRRGGNFVIRDHHYWQAKPGSTLGQAKP